jgi:cell division protein FtsB
MGIIFSSIWSIETKRNEKLLNETIESYKTLNSKTVNNLNVQLKKNDELRLENDALKREIDSLKVQVNSCIVESEELKKKLLIPPPACPKAKPIKKKRIPYDIAPSQQ